MTYVTHYELDEEGEESLPPGMFKPECMTLYAWQLMLSELVIKHGPNAMLEVAVLHSDLGRDFIDAALRLSVPEKQA